LGGNVDVQQKSFESLITKKEGEGLKKTFLFWSTKRVGFPIKNRCSKKFQMFRTRKVRGVILIDVMWMKSFQSW